MIDSFGCYFKSEPKWLSCFGVFCAICAKQVCFVLCAFVCFMFFLFFHVVLLCLSVAVCVCL